MGIRVMHAGVHAAGAHAGRLMRLIAIACTWGGAGVSIHTACVAQSRYGVGSKGGPHLAGGDTVCSQVDVHGGCKQLTAGACCTCCLPLQLAQVQSAVALEVAWRPLYVPATTQV